MQEQIMIPLHNQNGSIVGYKDIKDVNYKIDILKVVNIILVDESNKVFISKVRDDVWKDGWGSSAVGLVRKDESSIDAARRILKSYFHISAEDLMFIEESYYDLNGIKRVNSIFYARTNTEPILNPNYILDGTWVDLEEIKIMMKKDMFNPQFLVAFHSIKSIIYFL